MDNAVDLVEFGDYTLLEPLEVFWTPISRGQALRLSYGSRAVAVILADHHHGDITSAGLLIAQGRLCCG